MVIIEIKTRLEDIGGLERQLAWYERSVMDRWPCPWLGAETHRLVVPCSRKRRGGALRACAPRSAGLGLPVACPRAGRCSGRSSVPANGVSRVRLDRSSESSSRLARQDDGRWSKVTRAIYELRRCHGSDGTAAFLSPRGPKSSAPTSRCQHRAARRPIRTTPPSRDR